MCDYKPFARLLGSVPDDSHLRIARRHDVPGRALRVMAVAGGVVAFVAYSFAVAETIEYDLPQAVGPYEAGTTRDVPINLGRSLYRISNLSIRWSGSGAAGDSHCLYGWSASRGYFGASFYPEASAHADSQWVGSNVVGETMPFSETSYFSFIGYPAASWGFLRDGTAMLHVSFLGGFSTGCTAYPPYAYGSLDSATLVVVWYYPHDYDFDDDVDLIDFGHLQSCFNGPNRPPAQLNCTDADFDRDADVDLADFDVFNTCFNGPNRRPNC